MRPKRSGVLDREMREHITKLREQMVTQLERWTTDRCLSLEFWLLTEEEAQ